MKRPGRRRPLVRGEGLTDAQPCEGEFHGGHRGAEPDDGGAFELGCRGVAGLGCGSARGVLAGVGGCGRSGGHGMVPVFGSWEWPGPGLTTRSRRRFAPAPCHFVRTNADSCSPFSLLLLVACARLHTCGRGVHNSDFEVGSYRPQPFFAGPTRMKQ